MEYLPVMQCWLIPSNEKSSCKKEQVKTKYFTLIGQLSVDFYPIVSFIILNVING